LIFVKYERRTVVAWKNWPVVLVAYQNGSNKELALGQELRDGRIRITQVLSGNNIHCNPVLNPVQVLRKVVIVYPDGKLSPLGEVIVDRIRSQYPGYSEAVYVDHLIKGSEIALDQIIACVNNDPKEFLKLAKL
jgi:hypothetical protein